MNIRAAPSLISFGSKAETLETLKPILKKATILELARVSVREWQHDRAKVLEKLGQTSWLQSTTLIVRSSAAAEDRAGQSLAGHFMSLLNVPFLFLGEAIDQVVTSFAGDASANDEVFIQPMLKATCSGVMFTRDPNTNAPYLVINYEDRGDTTAVTSGNSNQLKTYVYWKGSRITCPPPLDRLAALAEELEALFGNDSLDVEFGFDRTGILYLFQVRPLVVASTRPATVAQHAVLLEAIEEKIKQANRPHPYLRGKRTLYGVMPDWNPAEIVGIRPRPLALSMYRRLVTDSVWAYQRHNYGYRNLRSFPLMLSFHGLPYIDVRLSFNSFIPGDIPDPLADRLVDCYIDQLAAAPVLHDKVEFEIVYSCYTFDLTERLQRLRGFDFSDSDTQTLTAALRRLTNRIVGPKSGLWRADRQKIDILERRQGTLRSADLDTVSHIYWLLEDCKRYGTLPFAGLARAGFVAVQMLKSLVAVDALTPAQYDAYMASLETVSGKMARDLHRMTRPDFLREYGHLRPGTYDITSLRYDEDPDRYLAPGANDDVRPPVPFALTLPQMRQIDKLLRQHELEMDVVSLFEFLEAGIQGREHAKFVFSRSLSDSLSLLVKLGTQHGISRDDMSYLDAAVVEDLYASSGDIGETIRHSIQQGKARYAEAQRIALPPLISSPDDIWGFHIPPTEPNYITQGRVEAPSRSHEASHEQLKGAIVVIPSADPGFDWLFACGIAGLVTAYGGVNSHMAIRAGELKLPAVIGIGEVLYNQVKAARRLRIDCAARRIDIL